MFIHSLPGYNVIRKGKYRHSCALWTIPCSHTSNRFRLRTLFSYIYQHITVVMMLSKKRAYPEQCAHVLYCPFKVSVFFLTVCVSGPYTTGFTPDSLFLVLWTSCNLYRVNCNWWNQEAACLESLTHAFIKAVTSSSKHWQSSTWKHFCYVL